MKKSTILLIGVVVSFGFLAQDVLARGGTRGGGGDRGGNRAAAVRGGGAAQRSPSMSRPAQPRQENRQATRPARRDAVSRPAAPRERAPRQQETSVPRERANRPDRVGGATGVNRGDRAQAVTRPDRGDRIQPGARPGGGRLDNASRASERQVQQFLNLPRGPESDRGSNAGRIAAGTAAGALGAEGARRLLEGREPDGEGRPVTLAGRPGTGERPVTLPGRVDAGDRPSVGDRPGGGDLPGAGDRPGIGNRPGGGDRPGIGHRPDRPNRPPDRPAGDRIRNNIRDWHSDVFTPQWWRRHPGRWHWGPGYDHWRHWWRPAAWTTLNVFLMGSAISVSSAPINFAWGDSAYYEGDNVFIGGQKTATAGEFYQQASQLATSAPAMENLNPEDWLPLGVFALTQDNAAYSNMLVQLAVNKEGVLTGTFFNLTTDGARPIKGMVDKKTQRAAWTFADGKDTDIIMEAGLYNLTQDQTEALVHFGKDITQQWLMVRLDEPDDKAQTESK